MTQKAHPETVSPSCGTCRFSVVHITPAEIDEKRRMWFSCHRRAPAPINAFNFSGGNLAIWPAVLQGDRCGEWEARA